MSTKPFSKSFLYLINKIKIERKFPIATRPTQGSQPAHGCFWPGQEGQERGESAWLGLSAQGRNQPNGGRAREWPRRRSWQHDSVVQRSGGRCRPQRGMARCARGPWEGGRREKKIRREKKKRGSSDHSKAECGGAMAGGGANAQGRLYLVQPAKLSWTWGVRERGGAVCSLLRVAVDHRRLISSAGGTVVMAVVTP
jgi:hypothetical protein